MRKEEFAEIFGDISEKYITEAEAERRSKKTPWLRWGAMAACLCLVVAGAWCMSKGTSPNSAAGGVVPGGATVGAESLGDDRGGENDAESYREVITEPLEVPGVLDAEPEDAPGTVTDAPTFEISADLVSYMEDEVFAAAYGGCYLDENGCWVVWLTENTEDYRCAALARNPALPEMETIFKTADFSLAYLTELLASISEGMRDGSLPYVTSAAVMEQSNRVSVTVTTEDVDLLATVLALDALGGAIELHYESGNAGEALAIAE